MKTTQYQPKTGQACGCKRGVQRDNCPQCEGTGQRIDFKAIRERQAPINYTLKLWRDDMGTFTQPGCRDAEDALWHINSARDHDGLPLIELDDLNDALKYPKDSNFRAELLPVW